MNKTLPLVTTTLLSSFLASQAFALGGYVEAQAGMAFTKEAKSSVFSSDETGDARVKLEYDPSALFGLEVGLRGFERHDVLRVGIAWERLSADLDTLTLTTDGGDEFNAGQYEVEASELKAFGYDFDNDVDLYTANLYYDFPTERNFRFYIGAGYGIAEIQNADSETAATLSFGGRYAFSDSLSLGIRYRAYFIDNPTDDLGIRYNSIRSNAVSLTLGFNF